MSARAPDAIRAAYDACTIPTKVFSGIVGDVAHSFGYHLAANDLPADDYSVVRPLDKQGARDAASALDIKLGPADMIAATKRVRDAAKAGDARLAGLREIGGTLDGVNTYAYDLATGSESFNEWDASHLWHVHLSGWRAYADNAAVWLNIIAVLNGEDDTLKLDTQDQAFIRGLVEGIGRAVIYGDDRDDLLAKRGKTETHVINLETIYNMLRVQAGLTPAKIAEALVALGVGGNSNSAPIITDEQIDRALRSALGSLDNGAAA